MRLIASSLWSCCRNSANNAWYSNGNNGYFNNNNMYNSCTCLGLARLELFITSILWLLLKALSKPTILRAQTNEGRLTKLSLRCTTKGTALSYAKA